MSECIALEYQLDCVPQIAYWFGFAAVAGAFGGIIAFGVQNAHVAIQNWRLLFIIEVRPPAYVCVLRLYRVYRRF